MDIEKYKAQVGAYIKKTRKAKKMSQRELITDDDGFQIVSEKTLIEIEKGRKAARPDTLNLLLRKLDKSMVDVLAEFENDGILRFENRAWEIHSLMLGGKNEQANSEYEQLDSENWYNRDDPKTAGMLLSLKAGILGDVSNEIDLALEAIQNHLLKTHPALFKSETTLMQLDEQYIEKTTLKKSEYLKLVNISILYADKDELETTVNLLSSIIISITDGLLEASFKASVLCQIYYILSYALLESGSYEDSLVAITHGIELCEQTQNAQNLGWLHFNKGIALTMLGNKESAKDCFSRAHTIFAAFMQDEYIEDSTNYAKEEFGIEL
jgi:transcriptional regulator with XRE-family HTH domain